MAESIEWVRIDQQSLHTDYPLMDSLHAALRHATRAVWSAALACHRGQAGDGAETHRGARPAGSSPRSAGSARNVIRAGCVASDDLGLGERILSSLERTFLVPRESGPALALPAFDLRPRSTRFPIPFTESGFARFVERAKQSGSKWSELNQISKDWFQRPFPKGVLGKEQTENAKGQDGQKAAAGVAMVKTGKREVSVEAPWIKGGLAVTRVPNSDPARWSLTHSGNGSGHGVLPDGQKPRSASPSGR